jgi:hypothetical protein
MPKFINDGCRVFTSPRGYKLVQAQFVWHMAYLRVPSSELLNQGNPARMKFESHSLGPSRKWACTCQTRLLQFRRLTHVSTLLSSFLYTHILQLSQHFNVDRVYRLSRGSLQILTPYLAFHTGMGDTTHPCILL